MKYSAKIENSASTLLSGLSRTGNYSLLRLDLFSNGLLVLQAGEGFIRATSRQKEVEENATQEIKTIESILLKEQTSLFSPQRVIGCHFQKDDCFLILKDPLSLYFLTKKDEKIIPITLEEALPLSEAILSISYPNVFIYGHNKDKYQNYIYSLNLTTFEVKQICSGKGYSPKGRSHYFALFSEDRLYVLGGLDKKGSNCEELLWTFDFEKGYWFALEMKAEDPSQLRFQECSLQAQYENGKVVIIKKNEILLMELYQSRIAKLELTLPQRIQRDSIGVFTLNKQLHFYDKAGLLPWKVSLDKIKPEFAKEIKKLNLIDENK